MYSNKMLECRILPHLFSGKNTQVGNYSIFDFQVKRFYSCRETDNLRNLVTDVNFCFNDISVL